MPAGNAELINDLSISGTIIPGGSAFISFTAAEEIKTAYVALKGLPGYFEYNLPAGSLRAAGAELYFYNIVLLISQELLSLLEANGLTTQDFIITISCVAVSGTRSMTASTDEIEVIEVGTGTLQVSLLWDQLDDVDLHLLEPDGNEIYYGRRRSYTEEYEILGELDLDSNAGCGIDEINNENITYENDPPAGTYYVAVDLWSKCGSSSKPGATYSVTVHYKGAPFRISNKQNGEFEASDEGSYNSASKFHIIGGFEITAAGAIRQVTVTDNPFVSNRDSYYNARPIDVNSKDFKILQK